VTRRVGAVPAAAGRRFEAIVVADGFARNPRVGQLLAELARAGVETAIVVLGPGGRRAARRGRARRVFASASTVRVARLAESWWAAGIRPSQALVLEEADALTPEPSPDGPTWLTVSTDVARAILTDQSNRRARGDLPEMPVASSWTVVIDGADPARERARDVRLAMVDGVTGTLGSPLVDYSPAIREVYVAGVYRGGSAESNLLRAPDWTRLAGHLDAKRPVRRVLDMRTGLVHHDLDTELGHVQAVSFASRAQPGIGVLRAAGKGARSPRSGFLAVPSFAPGRNPVETATRGPDGDAAMLVRGAVGGIAVAARESRTGRADGRRLERIVAVRASGRRTPSRAAARGLLDVAANLGFDRLLADQRSAWASRWRDADIRIEGDREMQRAIRFALFELMAHAPDRGEAAIGARGVTGVKYRGHVFWDTDVFVLPFLAATEPRAARAVLEYRVRRLDAARAAARESGYAGAWMPWESAADGRDVTPDWIIGADGLPLHVLTGKHELHIVADVAWAAATYADWTGDRAFESGPGRELLVETARFWASRLERTADGSAHLTGVIGPDEYHNLIADNAFTNVMARWNLRRAAALGDAANGSASRRGADRDGTAPGELPRGGAGFRAPDAAEREAWLDLAGRIVDGFDSASGIYEQFRGFFDLEPIKIVELATRPLSGEVFLGRDRVASTQCVKQPDVLMLYQLVPDELLPGTLAANLDFYDPRTSFGSSLGPGIHAALMARAGRPEDALAALRLAASIDLDDARSQSAEGLHVATMGSLWQAIVHGFAGIRPDGDQLTVDPHIPSEWRALEVPFRLRGRRIRVRIEHDRVRISANGPVTVRVAGLEPVVVGRRGIVFR
jgi:trehalose/maltose hydrolase-like predicted phosphorylase